MHNRTQALQSKKNSKGFTLIEMIIAVVIIGLFFALVVPLLTGVRDKNVIVMGEAAAMERTLNQIYARYSRTPLDVNFTNEEAIQGRVLAESYRTQGNQIFNGFRGNIEINGINVNGLSWESQKINREACSELIMQTMNLGFDTVDITPGSSLDLRDEDDRTPGNVSAACTGSGSEVTITWEREGN